MSNPRKRRPTDSNEYLDFMQRIARNLAKRAVDDGIDSLHSLAVVAKMQEEVMAELVTYLRSVDGGSYSWSQIGEAVGITRQSAQVRFGGTGARKPGGQPSHLR